MKPEDPSSPATPCPSREQLAAFAGGFLPSQALDAIATHLSQCPKCESAFEAMVRAHTFLGSRPRTPPDDGFSDEAERAPDWKQGLARFSRKPLHLSPIQARPRFPAFMSKSKSPRARAASSFWPSKKCPYAGWLSRC